MISNEKQWPDRNRAARRDPPKAGMNEETLKTEKLQIERKSFVFTLKENSRGRFLRITEDVGGRKDTIIIPAPGLEQFLKAFEAMAKASTETPPNKAPESDPSAQG